MPLSARRRARLGLFLLCVPGFVALLVAGVAAAQTGGRGQARGSKSRSADAGAPANAAATRAARVEADGGIVEAKTLDGGTHVFKFTELDIEGRLRSPQLVYFLRRVRAEFGAEGLGHRTFMREMSETRKESSF